MGFHWTLSEHYKQSHSDTLDRLRRCTSSVRDGTYQDCETGDRQNALLLGENFDELNAITDSTLFTLEIEFVMNAWPVCL